MHPARKVFRLFAPTLLLLLAAAPPVHAIYGPSVTIFPWYGYANFAKNVNLEDESIFGVSLGLRPFRYVGIEGHIGRSTTETTHGFAPTTPPTLPAVLTPQEVEILHYGFNLVVHFRPSAVVSPYVMAGWQEGRWEYDNEDSVPKARFENGWEVGGGIVFKVHPRIGIRAEFRDAFWTFPAGTPEPPGEDATDNQFYTAGLEFNFGGSTSRADTDNDGVTDNKDECPDTPAGARVDARGCPLDDDKDGVPDGIDQCPGTPAGARVDARGCPTDADNDRVPDGVDQCPDTPAGAVVDERGCPRDADSDGVPDGIDQCADTPAGTAVDARGCPQVRDADNDGVPDDRDLCPNTPAGVQVDKDGCVVTLTEREVELLDKGRITERDIHFETAKWDILPESYKVLDEIGAILIQWPRLRIEVGGHCDARGSDAYNLDLSEKRAGAVLDYLVSKYPQITREQYTARGYGERQPVATNKTVEGMARNRRVEFKVLNTEELTKERERRRALGSNE
jgi:outer membrane protein OmpA-like peptidoglycan-associated protein/opacity protein-like surface antigen